MIEVTADITGHVAACGLGHCVERDTNSFFRTVRRCRGVRNGSARRPSYYKGTIKW